MLRTTILFEATQIMEAISQLYQLLTQTRDIRYSNEIIRLFLEHFCVLHYEDSFQGVMIWNQTIKLWTYVQYDVHDVQHYINTIDHSLFPAFRMIYHQQNLEEVWMLFHYCIRVYLIPNDSATHQMFRIHCLIVYPNFISKQNLVRMDDEVIERGTLRAILPSREQYLHWSLPVKTLKHQQLDAQMIELINSLKASFFMEQVHRLTIIRSSNHAFIVEFLSKMFAHHSYPKICMDMEDLFINKTIDHDYINLTAPRVVFNKILHGDSEICEKLLESKLTSMHFVCEDISSMIVHCETKGIDYSVIRFNHTEPITESLLEAAWYYMMM